ncbi:unnamed protein product, partial [Mesorhabditis belari]|uniref:Uncharacterized protein n=1 Tax=Mesorhabditis belari TaxID=2138241 RepID=A0AAF3F4A7_9BILA
MKLFTLIIKLFILLCNISYVKTTEKAEDSKIECAPAGFTKCRDEMQCIDKRWMCDGRVDCVDKSDEDPKICKRSMRKVHMEGSFPLGAGGCLSKWFACRDGGCVAPKLVCNGKRDCRDNSDEGAFCNLFTSLTRVEGKEIVH